MASGFSNKVIGQTGEFAVCVQLGKMNLVATPFAGNLPDFDVIASNSELKVVPIQVKSTRGNDSWMAGDARDWLEIDLCSESGRQTILGLKSISHPGLITVYVRLSKNPGDRDRFFILTKAEVQQAVRHCYARWLEKHGGIRPKKQDSFHLTIPISELLAHEDRWSLVQLALTQVEANIAVQAVELVSGEIRN